MESLFAKIDISRFKVQSKVTHEFQAIGQEMEVYFGIKHRSVIWASFHKEKLTEIKYAFEQCRKRNIHSIKYLFGIIKKRKI